MRIFSFSSPDPVSCPLFRAPISPKGHWAKGAESRALLERYGVNVNDAANGARLGHPRPHNQTHTGAFQNSTNARLNTVRDSMQEAGRGGKAIRKGLRQELRSIGRELGGQ